MKKILVIEDDSKLLNVYVQLFSGEGFEIIQAPTGQEGLEAAKKNSPNVIILDIMLPIGKMNGFDVLEQLKMDQNLKNIPVVILTNLDSEIKTAMSMGASDYLVKSNSSIDDIKQKVKKYLQ